MTLHHLGHEERVAYALAEHSPGSGVPAGEGGRDARSFDGVHVLQLFEPVDGGVPEHVRLLAEGLAARRVEVTVAGPAQARPRARLEASGIRYIPLEIVGDMVAPTIDARTLAAVARLLGRERFDLVHTHSQKAGLLGRIAATATRTPTVYTPHSLIWRFVFVGERADARAIYRKGLWMERVLGRVTDAWIAVSDEEHDAAVALRLAPERRVHRIYNGVEIDEAAAPDDRLRHFRGDGPLLGFLAGLRLQKGLSILLDALERLAREGEAVRFAIVGNGPLDLEVRRRVASGSLAASTLVLPFDGRPEPYLRAFDGYVLPSLWEGLPLAALEAMAAGLPVIASDSGGTREAVADGETGVLFPVGDAPALAAALRRLAGDAALRARLGVAGRERWRERFMAQPMVAATAALYERVVAPGLRRTT